VNGGAVAMITPGPIVITAGFIGYYLVAGVLGAIAAAFAVFALPYFFVLLAAPFAMRRSGYLLAQTRRPPYVPTAMRRR